ncbi:hypothetical protein AB205_0197340 [Aquarana catesbeiana]|uniref:Uncharacterized protein n=1 Tax=Aquarana catesbeiana TaxID=8400 RepID=A0A2G9SLH2_AQUCT|nr:hypothetical protein AB205_0197340 [Aquarana catesbeiana]
MSHPEKGARFLPASLFVWVLLCFFLQADALFTVPSTTWKVHRDAPCSWSQRHSSIM